MRKQVDGDTMFQLHAFIKILGRFMYAMQGSTFKLLIFLRLCIIVNLNVGYRYKVALL